jgi:hypothetical protein
VPDKDPFTELDVAWADLKAAVWAQLEPLLLRLLRWFER